MKKKLLALLLAVAMVSVLVPVSALAEEGAAPKVARIDTVEYTAADLPSAVDGISDGTSATITLLGNVELTESIVIDNGQEITIEMGGFSISKDTIPLRVMHGSLSLEGTGSVVGTLDGGHGAIVVDGTSEDIADYSIVNIGQNITLKGIMGIFVNPNAQYKANGVVVNFDGNIVSPAQDSYTTAGNAFCIHGTIQQAATNCPKITIGPSASINASRIATSCAIYAAGYADWTINGGSFIGEQCIEMKAGKMVIKGGTFEATGTEKHVSNNSGTSSDGHALALMNNGVYGPGRTVTIEDGSFDGRVAILNDATTSTPPTLVVEGGKFVNYLADDYLDEDKSVKSINETPYLFEVVDTADLDVKLAPATAAVTAPENATNATTAVYEAISEGAVEVCGIEEVLAPISGAIAPTDIEEQFEQLKALEGNNELTEENVAVFIQPFMDIKVADAVADGTSITSLTLDIKPMYQTVIAPKNVSAAAINTTESTGNAVKVGDAKPLSVPQNTPVVISFKLPAGFVVDNNLKVKHVKANGDIYYYDVEVEGASPNQIATFTVTNGFSEFTLKSDTREAVVDFRFNTEPTETGDTTLVPTDVGISLPTDYKAGSSFNGWEFGTEEEEVGFTRITGADGVYTVLPDAVLTALDTYENESDEEVIVARPVFTANYVYDIFADSLINPVEVTEDPLDVQEATDETDVVPDDETDALPDEGDIVDESADEPVPATGDLAASALPALLPLIALAFAAKKKH